MIYHGYWVDLIDGDIHSFVVISADRPAARGHVLYLAGEMGYKPKEEGDTWVIRELEPVIGESSIQFIED